MKHDLLSAAAVAVIVNVVGLAAYHHFHTSRSGAAAIAIVDVAEVYRLKEAEFARIVSEGKTDEERKRGIDLAAAFAKRLPAALDELGQECGCVVMVRGAVASPAVRTVDLTRSLLAKVS